MTDVRTGALPGASTTSVLLARVHGGPLAEFKDAGTATAARTLSHHPALDVIDPVDTHITGSVVWSYALDGDPPRKTADAGDRAIVHFCLTTPDRT